MNKATITLFCIFLSLSLTAQEPNNEIAKFLSSGNAYATMFFDYYYVLKGDNTYAGRSVYAMNKESDNAFSFRRVYFGYDHTFSDTFSAKVQLELSDRSTLPNGSRAFFLKDASLRWRNIFPLSDLYIGQIGTPVWSTSGAESIWRYRSIERTIADFRGLRSSSDSGIRLTGLFTSDGRIGYNLMLGNGTGARAESDKYKVVYMNIWTKLFKQQLYLELFQDYNEAPGNRSIYSTKGLVAWQTANYTLAAELVNQIRNGFGYDNENINFLGLSVFAHTDILPGQLRVFGRYDSYNPDVDFHPKHYEPEAITPFDEQFITFGFDYIPLKNIHVMPNIWINSYKNKVGGQVTPDTEVVARLTCNVILR